MKKGQKEQMEPQITQTTQSTQEATTVTTTTTTTTPATEMDQELQDMYRVVSGKIRLCVSEHQLTPESFETILVKVVETIEELSRKSATKLTGTEKRSIAINLTRLVIDDLHRNGQINDNVYAGMNVVITFVAPLVFSAAKAIWTKLQSVEADIAQHGRTGCCTRNFFSKK
jgi:hypothetical protein